MELALILLFITLLLIFIKPQYMGYSAILMALIAFRLGVVSFKDIIEVIDIVWDATLTFIGIIILSLILEEIGFFDWAAIKIAKFSRGNGILMFIYSILLGAFISALFANDTAAIILTPILIAKMKMLKVDKKTLFAFVFAGGFIADSASLPFIFSNLTNILTADFFNVGFIEYTKEMILPFFVSVAVSIIVFLILFRKNIPKRIDISLLADERSVIKDKVLFYFSFAFLAILFFGFIIGDFYHIPISVFALGGAFLLFGISCIKRVVSFSVMKKAPWQLIFFSIGLYVIVFGVYDKGFGVYLEDILKGFSNLKTGFLSGILSSVINNLPSVMLIDIAIKEIGRNELIYANILGANIGSKLFPFGTLSTLIWFSILNRNGIKISFLEYIKYAVIITPIVLFFTLEAL